MYLKLKTMRKLNKVIENKDQKFFDKYENSKEIIENEKEKENK